ncbi:MAG: 5-oxoprolinase subunit PxpB [Flavobacteriaceae bacterium]|nr:5-oxoprolinase subunit PxpB [Flavobacteriaceae bacterium]
MNKFNYQIQDFFQLNKQTLLIQLENEINPINLQHILQIKTIVKRLFPSSYTYNTYAEVGIRFPYFEDLTEKIKLLKAEFNAEKNEERTLQLTSKTIEVPVCYAEELAPDLNAFLQQKNMTLEKFIELHTQPKYLVYFIGFLPGFLYLGGLDKQLYHPRKANPDPKIEAGSVGIGHHQTGIYPQDSPGGWHIVGKTPIDLFDVNQAEASPFQSGDQIQFKPISLEEYKFQIQQMK